ncbi:MAG TPA: polysaccharide deacetylase family protein [Anaerolineales bacterium]|nr:polysaccharide deacetylase family protein [Anaerolineales bacterium]
MNSLRQLQWTLILWAAFTSAWITGDTRGAVVEFTPSPSGEVTWVWNPPGRVKAPILLYHHVSDQRKDSRYFVSPVEFERQMESLKRWGYTPIPLSLLATALAEGALLPARPVVITFDDGYRDVYQHAFPILQEYGFVSAVYVISEQIGARGYLTHDQLAELVRAGWELGSHTKTHANLRLAGVRLSEEILGSRGELETYFGVPVMSFSYPYGSTTAAIRKLVEESGYAVAVGLGGLVEHTEKTRFYLSRIEVQSEYDLKKFSELLTLAVEGRNQPNGQEQQKFQPR